MPKGQEKEFMELSKLIAAAIEAALAEWQKSKGTRAPSGWVVAFLMELAGQLVKKAPVHARAEVLLGAIEVFGEASGGVMLGPDGPIRRETEH